MKKLLLSLIFATLFFISYSQELIDSTPTKVYHNEFGIDMTGFIKQFLQANQVNDPFGGSYPVIYYDPFYYLTYRRHFKKSNLRFAIGGDFSKEEVLLDEVDESEKYYDQTASINLRLGWEFFNDIGKRWQAYYGLDFRAQFIHIKNDDWSSSSSGGYARGREFKTKTFGIAPLIGFRFKLTDRLSISTEATFSINWQENFEKQYYTPLLNFQPPLPEGEESTNKEIFTSFLQPLSLFLTFDI